MAATLKAAGGATTATELGLPVNLWRRSMKYARDVRNRWSFLTWQMTQACWTNFSLVIRNDEGMTWHR